MDAGSVSQRARLLDQVMWKSTVPEAQVGNWKVERFTISEDEAAFFNLRNMINGRADRNVTPGSYTKLTYRGEVIMSDTPAELNDHAGFVMRARGNVLVTGLGLGVVVDSLLGRDYPVDSVTVVEVDPEVIALTGPHLKRLYGRKVRIVEGDAFNWKPDQGDKFDAVWHDIWPTISGDNRPEMTRLRRRYSRYLAPDGFQECWLEREVRALSRARHWGEL